MLDKLSCWYIISRSSTLAYRLLSLISEPLRGQGAKLCYCLCQQQVDNARSHFYWCVRSSRCFLEIRSTASVGQFSAGLPSKLRLTFSRTDVVWLTSSKLSELFLRINRHSGAKAGQCVQPRLMICSQRLSESRREDRAEPQRLKSFKSPETERHKTF